MKKAFVLPCLLFLLPLICGAQKESATAEMKAAASRFLESLDPAQKKAVQFSFTDEERYHWNYVPMERKGLALKQMSAAQLRAAMNLLQAALSDSGFKKTKAIIELEAVLREVEHRSAGDPYRDPGKYYVSVFGNPAADTLWGWRLEGHHIAFNFTSDGRGLISGTPGFLGANPAVILSGHQKGKEVLREETRAGFALLHTLSSAQKEKAVISAEAPFEIITGASRKAMIKNPQGILYSELTGAQKQLLLHLVRLYVHRYKEPFARKMMEDLEGAGLSNIRFAWAGAQQPGLGNPHYYRIQGPTFIIEYDNTQNNANHVHSVIRDLKNDFGGDQLLEHYRASRH